MRRGEVTCKVSIHLRCTRQTAGAAFCPVVRVHEYAKVCTCVSVYICTWWVCTYLVCECSCRHFKVAKSDMTTQRYREVATRNTALVFVRESSSAGLLALGLDSAFAAGRGYCDENKLHATRTRLTFKRRSEKRGRVTR